LVAEPFGLGRGQAGRVEDEPATVELQPSTDQLLIGLGIAGASRTGVFPT
jgi:hypothetical protein